MPSHRHPARQEPEIPPEQYVWTENRYGEEVSIMAERARFGAVWEFWESMSPAGEWRSIPWTQELVRAAIRAEAEARK